MVSNLELYITTTYPVYKLMHKKNGMIQKLINLKNKQLTLENVVAEILWSKK